MKQHLLLVDDDRDELRILSYALQDAGIDCKCTWATCPLQALDILQYLSPDFIFMDYSMPKMNGIECIARIRERKRCDRVPIVLYSSELSDTLIKHARETGAQYCLKKTSDTLSLNRQLQMIFSQITNAAPA
jgi:CheY-like chemotaxis protein